MFTVSAAYRKGKYLNDWKFDILSVVEIEFKRDALKWMLTIF